MITRRLRESLIAGALLAVAGCNDSDLHRDPAPVPEPEPSPAPTAPPGYSPIVEFLAVDLDNINGSSTAPFGVTVSNLDPTYAATVAVLDRAGATVATATVQPKSAASVALPSANLEGTMVGEAFRVRSDLPVTVHQHNPLGNMGYYTNDGSRLTAVSRLGTDHLVLAWPQSAAWTQRGYLTVAADDGPTKVEVTVAAPTIASNGGVPVPALEAGETLVFTLERQQALNLVTRNFADDLTGTRVVSDRPVAVFGGNECAFVPLEVGTCDHLEEQLPPVGRWGTSFLAAKSPPRGAVPDVWRVLAREDGTVVSADPPQPGLPAVLAAGEMLQLMSFQSFRLETTAPALVGQFLVGQSWGDAQDGSLTENQGDPTFVLVPPLDRLRSEYVFFVPPGYWRTAIVVGAPDATAVRLDGEPIPGFAPVAGGWSAATADLAWGPHRVDADGPVQVSIFGLDFTVAFGLSAGELEEAP